MDIVLRILAVLVYPGVLLALLLGVAYSAVALRSEWKQDFAALRQAARPTGWSSEQAMAVLSVLLAGCGLALLPWPWHPALPGPVGWLWAWAALEAAFVLHLLPGLLSGHPLIARAAIRSAQIGVTGRTLLWLALGVGLMLHGQWELVGSTGQSPLLAHMLALLAGVFAFPAAIGWGPYTDETNVTPGGLAYGLNDTTARLTRAAHAVRVAALLAASLVALLPVALLPPPLGILLVLVAFGAVAVLLERLRGLYPRQPLPVALHNCLWRALPLGAAAVIYLSLV